MSLLTQSTLRSQHNGWGSPHAASVLLLQVVCGRWCFPQSLWPVWKDKEWPRPDLSACGLRNILHLLSSPPKWPPGKQISQDPQPKRSFPAQSRTGKALGSLSNVLPSVKNEYLLPHFATHSKQGCSQPFISRLYLCGNMVFSQIFHHKMTVKIPGAL